SPTEDEARAVITHIRNQATQRGTTIARIDKWLDGRDPDTLRHDLAHIRAQTTRQGPGCGIHRRKTLPCRMCAIAAATGDFEPLLPELKRVGADERPDLADLCAGHSYNPRNEEGAAACRQTGAVAPFHRKEHHHYDTHTH